MSRFMIPNWYHESKYSIVSIFADVKERNKDDNGAVSGRSPADLGSNGFGFGFDFSSTVFAFGYPKLIRFGFGFWFSPADTQ
jgi:hypothetical protein